MLAALQFTAEDLQGLDAAAADHIATLLIERAAAIDVEHGRQISELDAQIKFNDVLR